ncbi:MAG TPA: hypothetical protein ENN88_01580 [Candidatus Coatesbacteria bacterium]|nr:hypothetical protein [Candidatus Coatesbacteria bacterium]
MRVFIIVTHPPYGGETVRSALRIARRLAQDPQVELAVFLMADAVYCARRSEAHAEGLYNPGLSLSYSAPQMLAALSGTAEIFACGTCMGERGFKEDELLDGVGVGTLDLLADYAARADRLLTF